MLKILILMLFFIFNLYAYEIKNYGFSVKNGNYYLIENQKDQCLINNICSINYIKLTKELEVENLTPQGKVKALNSYNNNLFFIPDLNITLGSFENQKFNKDLNSITLDKSLEKILQDEDNFFKKDFLNVYGKDFNNTLKITYITKDMMFFDNFVSYSYSFAAHPSFYESGFALDLKNKKIKTYILKDLVKNNIAFKKLITKKLKNYFEIHKRYDLANLDFFKNNYNFNILEQDVSFKEDSLYINLRILLAEVGRNLDFFKISYKDLKPFAKGDLVKITNNIK
ncbi:hypothetical protein JG677_03405 [Campylobacter sp. TTU-622]|uniref:hypothetical protein n=2 Tax=unclassified Campylobacter TaxID=2593542 RepID=UPI001905ABD3|nr:hypothetical protein [Campylobacter sp. TTU-622]MBK1973097.1 hypothetical protein [Campylobacter sp. TTU-622]